MDELVDILDANGNSTGFSVMKSEAHQKGLFHPTVHIWFYTKKGDILLQQRGKNKSIFPLLWDVSVAGHIEAGEDYIISAIREIQEELGLLIPEDELQKIGVFKSMHAHKNGLLDYEFHHTYSCELKVPLDELTKQESEIEALTFTPLSSFYKKLTNTASSKLYVPHSLKYYSIIIQHIKEQLL